MGILVKTEPPCPEGRALVRGHPSNPGSAREFVRGGTVSFRVESSTA